MFALVEVVTLYLFWTMEYLEKKLDELQRTILRDDVIVYFLSFPVTEIDIAERHVFCEGVDGPIGIVARDLIEFSIVEL